MDVQLIRYPEAAGLAPREAGCDVKLVDASSASSAACRDVGDVFVGDAGFSWNCGHDRVIAEVRQSACRLGANAAVVRVLGQPSSSCRQVRARLLSCVDSAPPSPA